MVVQNGDPFLIRRQNDIGYGKIFLRSSPQTADHRLYLPLTVEYENGFRKIIIRNHNMIGCNHQIVNRSYRMILPAAQFDVFDLGYYGIQRRIILSGTHDRVHLRGIHRGIPARHIGTLGTGAEQQSRNKHDDSIYIYHGKIFELVPLKGREVTFLFLLKYENHQLVRKSCISNNLLLHMFPQHLLRGILLLAIRLSLYEEYLLLRLLDFSQLL